jgi:hypothetical protein
MVTKSPNSNKILAELMKVGKEILHSEFHELTNYVLNKEKLPQQWKMSIIETI